MYLFNLKGKKAVVTGGGNGIGRAISEGLHDAGAEVAIIDYSPSVLSVCKEIQKESAPVYGIIGDLSDRKEIKNIFQNAIKLLKTVDILANCAGTQKRNRAEDFSLEDWDKIIEINLTAVFQVCQLAGKIMLPKGAGKIINIASMNSFTARKNISAYVASKGGIAQLTKAFAVEWAMYGINVNAIAPGYFKTEMTKTIWSNTSLNNEVLSRIPAGAWGNPEDLKGTAIFLASEASDYINGAIIPVDGGYSAY